MSLSKSTTDWTKCFICQKVTKEKLRLADEGRKTLSSLLPKFAAKNALSFDINRIQMGEQDLEVSLNINNGSSHHSCKNAYNDSMYERLIEKEKRNTNAENEDILKSPPTKRRSTVHQTSKRLTKQFVVFVSVLIFKKI